MPHKATRPQPTEKRMPNIRSLPRQAALAFMLCLPVLIGACTMAPTYSRPGAPVPNAYAQGAPQYGTDPYQTQYQQPPVATGGVMTLDDVLAKTAITLGVVALAAAATFLYLPMQFLSSNSNQRTDQYGGSAENRVRFAVETLKAMAQAIGPAALGAVFINIAPIGRLDREPGRGGDSTVRTARETPRIQRCRPRRA